MRALIFILIKEFKQIFRNQGNGRNHFWDAIIQLVVLGFSITNEAKNVSLMISDRDNGRLVGKLSAHLKIQTDLLSSELPKMNKELKSQFRNGNLRWP